MTDPSESSLAPPSLNDPLTVLRLSRSLSAVAQLLNHFGLSRAEQAALLAVSVRSLQRAARGHNPVLTADQLTRMSLVVGMVQAIEVLYSPATGQGWFSRPNRRPPFHGLTPAAYMQREGLPGLIDARRRLDADCSSGLFEGTPEASAQAKLILQPEIQLDE